VFIAGATINDPSKVYHLEIPILNIHSERIDSLRKFFLDMDISPNIMKREKKTSLYFKSNTVISDILSYIGARRSGFLVANTYIERDIRNNENRATNFVAKNISKSVTATQKQIAAINKLKEADKLSMLPAELLQTALLRVENDAVSLSELALLHDPPISKSGLNHRLEKICKFSEEI
jgi:DNA-binding protein WhiA